MRRHREPVEITIQYFDGCPNWKDASLAIAEAAREIGLSDGVMCFQRLETDQEARLLAFRGSPTILIDGIDPFAELDAPTGLTCRVFRTEHGLAGRPSLTQLQSVLKSAVMTRSGSYGGEELLTLLRPERDVDRKR